MYEKILVPIARTEESKQVLGTALEMAVEYGAEVHLLQVVDIQVGVDAGYNIQKIIDLEETRGNEQLEEMKTRFTDRGLDVKTSVIVDIGPAQKILEYADENDIDLIVMATHGRSGVSRLFLGSTTERVLRGSRNRPVLVVPIRKSEEQPEKQESGEEVDPED